MCSMCDELHEHALDILTGPAPCDESNRPLDTEEGRGVEGQRGRGVRRDIWPRATSLPSSLQVICVYGL